MKRKYTGKLDYFVEQGCGSFPMFFLENSYSFDEGLGFDKNCDFIITIFSPENSILYAGPWTFSKSNTSINNYFYSPQEINPKEWILFCSKNLKAEIITSTKMNKDKFRIKLPFESYFNVFNKENKEKIINGRCRDLVEGDALFVFHNGPDHREKNLGIITSFYQDNTFLTVTTTIGEFIIETAKKE